MAMGTATNSKMRLLCSPLLQAVLFMNWFHYKDGFALENGSSLPGFTLCYHTYGQLNARKDNVIWICHALTASSDVEGWWPELVGDGLPFDTRNYFVVCVNIIGSCYGSTGPLSINPLNNTPFYHQFPFITIRDMVGTYQLLAKHLDIQKIQLLVGGSMGGYQALEWSLMQPTLIEQLFLLVTSARESSWRIAIHTAQRMAIEADGTFAESFDKAGEKGLKAARAIGMLTYRNPYIYEDRQRDEDTNKLDHFKASSYIEYQGNKLAKRFNAFSYWVLTKAMDTHNLARGRNKNLEEILNAISQRTLIIGIETDILCPLHEQEYLAQHIPNSELIVIHSEYGHDGFLTERKHIETHLQRWLKEK
jgi:homoserine O-acetyltransferase/O-succinyltransferase